MYHFKRLAVRVEAMQTNSQGKVYIRGREFVSTPGYWVVIDDRGEQTNWSDQDFRRYFEPADDKAKEYLAKEALRLS